jgi:ubiquinone/menaquinone biosynthesis C-methylase UbiE/acyl carrier protein
MIHSGSYNVASFATSMEAEIRRLNAQVDLFWTLEYSLLKRYGLRNGMDILDCGCGPGRLIELLKGQMPELRCTGLDMDARLVEAANQMIAYRGLNGCRVIQGTAEQPGLAGPVFDFIILRLVLEHVPDPVLALLSLSSLLKPGGRLVAIANDFEFHLRTWPPVPQLDQLYEAYCASRRKDGGDPFIGRRLPRLVELAEMRIVGYEIEVANNALLGDKPFLKAEGAGIPAQLVRTGFLSEEILKEITLSWRAMLSEPNHSITRPLFVIVGERKTDTEQHQQYPSLGAEEETAIGSVTAKKTPAKYQADTLATLLSLIFEVLGEDLEQLGKNKIEPEDILTELGMDSLAALNLQERIKNYTDVEISIVKLLDKVSVRSLAQYLDDQLSKSGHRPVSSDIPDNRRKSEHWEEGDI